jgi:transcriptional regulator with XRE-family HTH domain/GNAT superfamily N-acetyltransferase
VESTTQVDPRIGARIRELRARQGLSLDGLATRSMVSRSMISGVERGEKNPSAVVLDKLAAALGVTLASLFEWWSPPQDARTAVVRHRHQPDWQDPASGYVRRNVSPAGLASPTQLVEVNFPPGARVAFESGARDARVYQQIWMLKGTMSITVGSENHRLNDGDCLAMQLDRPTIFHNPRTTTARYLVAITHEKSARRQGRKLTAAGQAVADGSAAGLRTSGLEIRLDALRGPEIAALLAEHLRCMAEVSPPESRHALNLDKLRTPEITFWTVWQGKELAGCGALKQLDAQHGEVKSMRTATAYLRKGVASLLLEHLISEAKRRGYRRLSLETGAMRYFKPAHKLYRKFGFRNCPPFNGYIEDPNSVFMTKEL